MRIPTRSSWLMLVSLIAVATDVGAQGWAPISVGARVGWDNKQREEVVGAHLRIPVLRSGVVELMPNADVTFLRGFKEYQMNLEAVYVLGDRSGGLYGGGGVGFRNSMFTGPRETVQTYSLVAGIRLGGLGRISPQVEVRWVFVDELPRNPQQVTLGASFLLWEAPPARR